jgi:hypothetical protein
MIIGVRGRRLIISGVYRALLLDRSGCCGFLKREGLPVQADQDADKARKVSSLLKGDRGPNNLAN